MADSAPASLDPLALLTARFESAIRAAFPQLDGPADALIAPNKNPKLGDYQSNAAMGLSKRVGKAPRDVAVMIIEKLDVADLCEPVGPSSIAGPGFINLSLKAPALAGLLSQMDNPSLGIVPEQQGRTVVVDLCGVNLAKEMHVGHLRSTIIGDALARIFARLGWNTIRQNHLGDWGLPIAMVTGRIMKEVAAGRVDLHSITLADLDKQYKAAQAECAPPKSLGDVAEDFGPFLTAKFVAEWADELEGARQAAAALAAAKRTLVDLQSKEPTTLAVWQRIVEVTIAGCAENCRRLGAIVLPEHTAGESSYADELGPVVEDLLARKVAEIDAGAVVVRLDKPEWGDIKEPCLIRKRDGGYLYATTDVAAIRRRVQRLGADRVVYCVDARQSLHFKQVFAAAVRAGYAARGARTATLSHAAFGTILGEDGRPFKTRSGENVKLASLIDEAVERATAKMTEMRTDVPAESLPSVAWAVGVSAIKYADLSIERIKDYTFSFDRMVAFEGNTGPYLLYAYARTRSIFRKAADQGVSGWESAPLNLADPAEKALALAMLRYPAALSAAAEHAEPHRLCQFLYDLAGAYSVFFTNCPILTAGDAELRASRLRLCGLTSRMLADALSTLGLPLVERM